MTACLFRHRVLSVIGTTHLNNLGVNQFKNPMILGIRYVDSSSCRYVTLYERF